MRLSDLDIDIDNLVADGEFDHFGYMNSDVDGKLFVHFGDASYKKQLENEKIACVICSPELAKDLPQNVKGVYVSNNAKYEFFRLFNSWGVKAKENEGFETKIGANCRISEMASIPKRNVIIGSGCVIEEFVSIKENTIIGDNVTIRSGAVIGTPGLQVVKDPDGKLVPVEHLGGVIIGNDVEIHALVSVEKAVFDWDNTEIGENTLINSYSTVGHGSKIGKRTMIASGMLLGGFSKIGDDVWIAIGTSIRHQSIIGDRAQVMMGSVVRKNIDADMVMVGDRILPRKKYERIQSILN